MIDVNLLGAWRVTAAAIDHLVESRGRVVLLGSRMSFIGLPLGAAYGVSKRALTAYADALRAEYGTHVSVTCIHPAFVRTPIHDPTRAAGLQLEGFSTEEPIEQVVATIVQRVRGARPGPRRARSRAAARCRWPWRATCRGWSTAWWRARWRSGSPPASSTTRTSRRGSVRATDAGSYRSARDSRSPARARRRSHCSRCRVRRTGNPWLDERTFINMAHQGGEDEFPSNTMYAFREALAGGRRHARAGRQPDEGRPVRRHARLEGRPHDERHRLHDGSDPRRDPAARRRVQLHPGPQCRGRPAGVGVPLPRRPNGCEAAPDGLHGRGLPRADADRGAGGVPEHADQHRDQGTGGPGVGVRPKRRAARRAPERDATGAT